jgi:hypothetical protein
MLPEKLPRIRNTIARLRQCTGWMWFFAIAVSCSTLPDASVPPHLDHDFLAVFQVGQDGKLHFPTTSRNLVVRSVTLQPEPASEAFDGDQRWFVYPPGITVRVRAQIRAYASGDSKIPSLHDILPAATFQNVR